jgi:BirA family biotin operon repressor/biotin-[acetyl-CoA-carboxylase] ligase
LNSRQERLLELLACGEMVSGETLGLELGISRAAVWKHLQALRELGIQFESVPSRGYVLTRKLERLDLESIMAAIDATEVFYGRVDVVDEIDSTNSELLCRAHQGSIHAQVLIAEYQHQGRGRRGREWVAPFASGLCLSMGWTLACPLADLGGLSVVLGVAAENAISDCGVAGVQLKWPNDLLLDGGKLGGLLVEVRGEIEGPCQIVAGIGINVLAGGDGNKRVDLRGHGVGRSQLAGRVIQRWAEALSEFDQQGITPWLEQYAVLDALADQPVRVEINGDWVKGTARGIDANGALRVQCEDGERLVSGGEVSVRRDHAAV